MKIILILIMVIVSCAIIVFGVIFLTGELETEPTPTPTPSPTHGPVVYVTSEQICDDYSANEVAAGLKYDGNIIQVSGYIYNISVASFTGNPVISLGGFYCSVRCGFSKEYEFEIAQLSEGQWLTVQGIFSHYSIFLKNTFLNACILVG